MIPIFHFSKNNKQPPKEKEEKKETVQNIPSNIEECQNMVRNIFGISSDIVIQVFKTKKGTAMIVYVDGLVDKDLVDRDLITPLKSDDFDGNILLALKATITELSDFPSFVGEILNGNTAVFYENSQKIFIADFKQWDMRSVETPDAEAVSRGPKEGFTENFRTNTSLMRRKIKTPKLIIESLSLGRQTNTQIALIYIDGIVNQEVLKELKTRLSRIDTDAILESGYIEQYIEENYLLPVQCVGITQKPDVAAAKILEGRVGILCDGTPHVLTVPMLFIENIQTSEDYYNRVLLSAFLRCVRILALCICIFLPALFVAVTTFNQEMIPSVFMSTIISSAEKTPLPIGAEVFFLIMMFELLKESGTRLPRTIGSAVSIVGALIIGDAAVNAGIVGAPVVIIVALTAVCSFIIPNLNEFTTIYRLFFLILAATMGLIGIGSGILVLFAQLSSAFSFGIPILSSFSKNERKDAAIRFPLWSMTFRPTSIAKENVKRQNFTKRKPR